MAINDTLNIRIKQRVDTKENWQLFNPLLLENEIGYEEETGLFKIGDGITVWNNLPYKGGGVAGDGADSTLFGDIDSNATNIPTGFIVGKNNKAIIRGRRILAIDGVNLTLDDVSNLAVGDWVNYYYPVTDSMKVDKERDQIIAINGNIVTFGNTVQTGITKGWIQVIEDTNNTDISCGHWIVPMKQSDAGTVLSFPEEHSFSVMMSGASNTANIWAFTQGYSNKAEGLVSQATGWKTEAMGERAHAEGYKTKALGHESHAEGTSTIASGEASHAEGANGTKATGRAAHATGHGTTASGNFSTTMGDITQATGQASLAIGQNTKANGYRSFAAGQSSVANGENAMALGNNITANGKDQIVFGHHNIIDNEDKYVTIIGNGVDNGSGRANAYTLDWDGNAWYAGSVDVSTLKINGTNINFSDYATQNDLNTMQSAYEAELGDIKNGLKSIIEIQNTLIYGVDEAINLALEDTIATQEELIGGTV